MMDEISFGPLCDRCPPRMMQEGESSKAYAAFQAYIEMGDARALSEMVKKWDGSKNSLYLWAKKYRWHERIDEATAEVAAIYRRETEKKAEQVATRIARQRIEIADSQFEIIKLAHAKAKEVLTYVSVKDIQATGKDGKTIIIKSNPSVRLGDAMRLLIGGNVAMNQADQILNPRKAHEKPNGSQMPISSRLESPVLEIWLDGGDGKPLPLSQMPVPDRLDPNFDPMSDLETLPESSNSPS